MKKIFLLFLIFTICSFSQEKEYNYHFDYCSVYDLKTDSTSIYKNRHLFGNSKDSTYFILLSSNKKNQVIAMSLCDVINNRQYEFETKNVNLDSIKSFVDIAKSYTIYRFDFSEFNSRKRSYIDVEYDTINNQSRITLKVYKNKRKTKLKHKNYFFTTEIPFVKNQFYVTDIVFAYKIDLNKFKTTGVLTKQYIIDSNGVEKLTRELISINQMDFNLQLKTEPILIRHL